MEVPALIDALEVEGVRLVSAAADAGLDAPVPTCPGWCVRDLLAHIGFVHRWATAYVRTALTEMVEEPTEATILKDAPADEKRIEWVAQGHADLVRSLRSAPADLVCWTFLAAPSPRAMWARRQAHETAVHAADAELAAGHVAPAFDPEFAADGVDELLFAFYGRPRSDPDRTTGVIGLEASDLPLAWTVRVTHDAVAAGPGRAACDVTIRTTASNLYLLLWHRRAPETLEVTGTAGAFERIWGQIGVTWQ